VSEHSDKTAAEAFVDHFKILPKRADRDLLVALGAAFATLPYENLTKLIRKYETEAGGDRRRLPNTVVGEHVALGAGGTCFALTRLFSAVLERFGYTSRPVLCDTRHRQDHHCALVVDDERGPLLLDPGYLLSEPIPLQEGALDKPNSRLVCAGEGAFDLITYGATRYRLKTAAVDEAHFNAVWQASFDWTMMNDIYLCRAEDKGYAYVHGHKVRLNRGESKETLNIRGHEASALGDRFGLDGALVGQAYALVAAARDARKKETP